MKTLSALLAAAVTLALCACASPGIDSVRQAKDVNAALEPKISEQAANFLVEMVDARLMDYQEGKLAMERGTQPTIRDYGSWMMRDQTNLLKQLQTLATSSAVMVPSTIGVAKLDGLKDLQAVTGESFDKRFMRSIRIDHERDVGAFKKASQFEDTAIREFALRNLPVIETHLEGIRQIEKAY